MGILKHLPTFKVIEVNRSTGLVMGHVLSQFAGGFDLTMTTKNNVEFVENGLIVGLTNDGTIENFDNTKHAHAFIVFNEELNTFLPGLKYYAESVEDGEVYPRAIGLYPGDVYTTNNFSGTLSSSTIYAKVVNGVLTLQTVADEDTMFSVEESTLPDGSDAAKITYLGNKKWVMEYSVTYVLDGGTNNVGNPETFVSADLPISLLDASKALHRFDGWFLEDTFETEVTEIDASGDITLYAKFTPEYSITYVLDGGTNDVGNPDIFVSADLPITLLDASKDLYTFDGWFLEDTFVTQVTEINASSDITIYAKFTII